VVGPASILGKLCEFADTHSFSKLTPSYLQWQANNHTQNLTVMILNRDSTAANSLGSAVLSAGMANANGSSTYGSKVGRLGFYEGDLSEYPDDESARKAVLENEIWGVIVGQSDHSCCLIIADSFEQSTLMRPPVYKRPGKQETRHITLDPPSHSTTIRHGWKTL
jgi:hypothetical protein